MPTDDILDDLDLPVELRDYERRVLGHLPRYRTQDEHTETEAHMRKTNQPDKGWKLPKALSVQGLVERVGDDPHGAFHIDGLDLDRITKVTAQVTHVLSNLEKQGLVRQTGDEWAMTAAGLDALTA